MLLQYFCVYNKMVWILAFKDEFLFERHPFGRCSQGSIPYQCQELKTFIGILFLLNTNKASHFGRGGTTCRDGEGIFSDKFTQKFNFAIKIPLTAARSSPGGRAFQRKPFLKFLTLIPYAPVFLDFYGQIQNPSLRKQIDVYTFKIQFINPSPKKLRCIKWPVENPIFPFRTYFSPYISFGKSK